MSDHARLSPSSRYRWANCPASVRACEQYPNGGKSSPAAIDGTHSHTLLEHCIKHAPAGTVDDPKKFLGTLLQDHDGMFGVDPDRVGRVRIATDYINERLKNLPGATVRAETRVNPAGLVGRDDMGGTVDVQIIHGDFLELIDYKDGMNEVSAINNHQLEQYAFGVLAEAMQQGKSFKTVMMTIVQPKIAFKGGSPISSHVVSVDELLGEKLFKIGAEAAATDDPNAPYVPGEKQCTYCAHRGNCSASASYFIEKAGIKFEDMNFAKDAAKKDPTEISDEQLRELVEAGPLLRKLIEAAEAEAMRRIMDGHPVAGLKVVRGRGSRSWALPEEETADKLTRMGIPKKDVWVTSLISPAKVEKLKWTKRDGSEKQLTERQLKVLENDLIAKSDDKLTVVPEADNRAAVSFPDVKAAFAPSWMS